jgi:hypothetical protein
LLPYLLSSADAPLKERAYAADKVFMKADEGLDTKAMEYVKGLHPKNANEQAFAALVAANSTRLSEPGSSVRQDALALTKQTLQDPNLDAKTRAELVADLTEMNRPDLQAIIKDLPTGAKDAPKAAKPKAAHTP